MIDYKLKNYEIIPLCDIPNDISYVLNNTHYKSHNYALQKEKIDFKTYKDKFDKVQSHISQGNSYLANLTSKTPISTQLSLQDIYTSANAKYKLYYKDKFICFSPEQFINIHNNQIFTYPMKGTIDASVKNAKEEILTNSKELAEHTMVVDLLRNDLSMVSTNVKVENFRYVESIKAGQNELLQVSSKISGKLTKDWHNNIGDILTTLMPAGSITGTPKKSTIAMLEKIEQYERDYFTGIFGVYDGNTLNSAVMIRFIEKKNDKLYYKSGGGITCDSNCNSEYDELNSKIYIP